LQEALHAFDVTAFVAHAAYAAASFFGFAADGIDAPDTQAAAPLSDPQLWNESIDAWQSVFLPHAAACLVHCLSMHLPQSVSLIAGAAGAGAGAAADAAGAGVVSVVAADEAGASVDSVPEAAGAAPPSALADSSAGVSGGLPPPHASHENGTARIRTRLATDMVERVMGGKKSKG
jgi:hypothetical protein